MEEFSNETTKNPDQKQKSIERQDRDIEFIKEKGFAAVVTAHLVDGGVDTTKVSISSGSRC